MSAWYPPDQPPPPPYPPPRERRPGTLLPVVAAVLIGLAFIVGLLLGQGGMLGPPTAVVPTSPPSATQTPAGPTASPGVTPTLAPGQTQPPIVTAPPASVPPQPTGAPANFDLFWQALEVIRSEFVGRADLTERDITYGAIRGLVEALGDTGHSVFLTPEALADEQRALEGRVVGVGALLGERNGRPVIVSVVSGGPASRAGLRSGDFILAVDGTNVENMTPSEIAPRVRGDAGTTVVVSVLRPSSSETLEFSMVREEINFPAASWTFVPGTRIAVLRLIQFSTGAADQLRAVRDEALAQGAHAFVLDLRSNPGGFVHESVRSASLFLDGRTVYIRELASGERVSVGSCGPEGNPGRPDYCRPEDSQPTDLPLVVLIDEGSASSAEILSGAIRSAGRAELVGTTTFGTGTVLLTWELADGSAIRIAVERWLTPDGELIFGQGITPTIEVEMPPEARALDPQEIAALDPAQVPAMEDVQLLRALEVLRSSGIP